jgi:hypothetical protein
VVERAGGRLGAVAGWSCEVENRLHETLPDITEGFFCEARLILDRGFSLPETYSIRFAAEISSL